MRDIIDVRGASGVRLPLHPLPRRAIPCRPWAAISSMRVPRTPKRGWGRGDGAAEVVYAGEARICSPMRVGLWDRAVAEHGVTDLFTRLNISERTPPARTRRHPGRRPPPMNAAEEEG